MNDDIKKAVQKSRAAVQQPHPKERAGFKSLLLANPNYFGNLADSQFTPVLGISENTHYEELSCVGYHPQQRRLEGVIYVYQPSGYGSDVCGPGTPEYVRFYLSFDNGATWHDEGLTSIQVYNIPEGTEGGKRLEYAVSLAVNPTRKYCFSEHIIRVRAVLSWNNPPPSNQPNWTPIWGNVLEAPIQVEPRRFFFVKELFEAAKIKFPKDLAELVDLEQPVPTPPKALGASQLSALYKNKGIPVHRFAFKELEAFISAKTTLSAEAVSAVLPGVALEPGVIDLLTPKADGDISYEELTCIGLDPNDPDTMVGVIRIKKAAGYSGGVCTNGSTEYVTFWADFDENGSFETCLGTASVTVYDLASLPSTGVFYAVRLPVDLNQYRRSCKEGARVVRIRAILSWNSPAPCANPNHVPTWGNREETLVHIAPKVQIPGGKIAILGGIPVVHLDDVTGLTAPTAIFALNNTPPDALGRPCPFAGIVSVQGTPINGYKYVVEVSPDSSVWTPVLNDLIVTDSLGNTTQVSADPVTKRFDYLPFTENVNNLLAQWYSAGDALWYVRLSVNDPAGVLQGTDTHRVQLDNTGPEASIDITTGGGNCGKFGPGTLLGGDFVARDLYFGRYVISVEPAVNPAGVGVPSPNTLTTGTAPSPGDSWSLDTTGMQPCGYVVRVDVWDRAIVNSQSTGHHASDSAGFCLLDNAGGGA
jgi:hypothetical protein